MEMNLQLSNKHAHILYNLYTTKEFGAHISCSKCWLKMVFWQNAQWYPHNENAIIWIRCIALNVKFHSTLTRICAIVVYKSFGSGAWYVYFMISKSTLTLYKLHVDEKRIWINFFSPCRANHRLNRLRKKQILGRFWFHRSKKWH